MSNKEKRLGRTVVKEKEEKKIKHIEETGSLCVFRHRDPSPSGTSSYASSITETRLHLGQVVMRLPSQRPGLHLGQGTKQEKFQRSQNHQCAFVSLWYVT
jgi:hypothetical protein